MLLDQLRAELALPHENPWEAVCAASIEVFRHFAADPELARRRYAVVREVPALRDREIVTVFRYERLFDEYLRSALPGLDPLDAVAFAAAVTAVHNRVLRQLLRGQKRIPVATLRAALDTVLRRFGVHPDPEPADDDVVVAVFPRRMPPLSSPAASAPASPDPLLPRDSGAGRVRLGVRSGRVAP